MVGDASTVWLAVMVVAAGNPCTFTLVNPYASLVAMMLRWMYGASSELCAGVTFSACSSAG